MKKKIRSYVIAILIPLAVGALSAFVTRNGMDIYSDVLTPPLSPPSIAFPIVWSLLFLLMGISSGIIYNSEAPPPQKRSALYTYGTSLFFNFCWSIIFFNLRMFLFSFVWLLLLLFLIVQTILKYNKITPLAAWLQVPYFLWVSFAGYLNFAIWLLN